MKERLPLPHEEFWDPDAPPTLLVLAAGLSTRYGGVKQTVPVGPSGETLLDYTLFDAARAGFGRAVLVVQEDLGPEMAAHLDELTGRHWTCLFAFQRPEDLPVGVAHPLPLRRDKPWGTGHAVWTGRHAVNGPFGVVNADDFYGVGAYRALARHLRQPTPADGTPFAAVTYRLDDTLSDTGGVSRAVCRVDPDGRLLSIREVLDIRRDQAGITGETPDGESVTLTGDEPVSMNIWGFTPVLFPHLEERLRAFLENTDHHASAEFYLSEALNSLIASHTITIRVVEGGQAAFGVTFPGDREPVAARIEELIAQGAYPADLRDGFRALVSGDIPPEDD